MDRFIPKSGLSTKRYENTKRGTKTTDTPRKPLPTHNRTPLKARQCKELNEMQQEAQKVSTLSQEIYNCNSNDSGICSTKSLSPPGKLGDYMNCPADKENDTSLIIPGNGEKKTDSASHKKNATTPLRKTIPAASVSIAKVVTDNLVQKPLPTNPSIWARIGKDLESPSAAVRMRALKATKDPIKCGYTQFDVPSAEQSLHIPYVEPPSLLEIMRNIIVYVEVRSGEDNRSAGVRKVIEALGARVNLTFLKDTTHVVFKDGLLSTYKKAKQMDIPVVSILWIEACKTKRRICDPKDYPISNIDRYENPELYSKMKRIKSMQPDSECNKRVRNKGGGGGGTPNHIVTPTQKTELIKKNSTLINDSTPTSSINQKIIPISQYFKKLNNESHNESPATQFLNKIHAETVRSDADMEISKTPQQQHVKKMLNFAEQGQGGDSKHDNNTIKVIISKKQTTETGWIEVDTATNCLETMAISNAASSNKLRKSRRRTINTTKNMTLEQVDNSTVTQTLTERKDVTSKTKEKKTETNKKLATSRRHTIYSVQAMGESEIKENTNKVKSPVNEKLAKRRRTLFTKEMKTVANKEEKDAETQQVIKAETENVIKDSKKVDVKRTRRTLFSIQPMDESDVKLQTEQEKETNTKTPTNAMKTSKEANKSNGSTPKKPPNQLETINEEVPERSKTTRRRTLYTPQNMLLEVEPLKIASLTPISKVMKGRGICTTPANICKIASNLSGTKRLDKNSHQQQQSSQSSGSTSSKTLTPNNQVTQTDVIVDEATSNCTIPLVFSSKRPPTTNRRRTLFDVSMDIITQRLQCINRTATSRRSMAMDSNNHASTPTGDNTLFKNNNNNNNAEEDDDDKTEEISLKSATPSTTTLSKDETKRKRKLFVPNNDLLTVTPPPVAATSTTTPLRSTSSIVSVATQASRPSLLHNAAEPSSVNCNNGNGVTETLTNPRRSTLDFESQREKTTSDTNNNDKKKNDDNGDKVAKRALPVLVYTNMHKEEVSVIREAVSKLGGFRLNCMVSDESSHLVTLDSRRTLNLLRALIRGLWIVRYDWVLESMKAGRWLAEEPFELQNFSRAIAICRSERQAFGSSYKSELFLNFGPFYVATRCGPISRNNARELITLCGGKLVGSRQKARYIIGENKGCPTEPDDKLCISSYWILDSITEMQILKLDKYICKATAPLAAAGGAGPKKPPLQ